MKRKGSAIRVIIAVIALLAIVALVVFFFKKCGGGFGKGEGDGSGQSGASSASSQEVSQTDVPETTVTTLATETETTVEVTVSGSEYLYQNKPIALNDLTAELKKLDSGVKVKLTDNNAAKNAYDELKAALDTAGIAYIEE